MVERGNRTRFALEAIVEIARRNLDGDGTPKPRIRAAVHFAHAAAADQIDDLVRTQLVSLRKLHSRISLFRLPANTQSLRNQPWCQFEFLSRVTNVGGQSADKDPALCLM